MYRMIEVMDGSGGSRCKSGARKKQSNEQAKLTVLEQAVQLFEE